MKKTIFLSTVLCALAVATSSAWAQYPVYTTWKIHTCGEKTSIPENSYYKLMQKQIKHFNSFSKKSQSEQLSLSNDGRANILNSPIIEDIVPISSLELSDVGISSAFAVQYFFLDTGNNKAYFYFTNKLDDKYINLETMILRKNKTVAVCPIN